MAELNGVQKINHEGKRWYVLKGAGAVVELTSGQRRDVIDGEASDGTSTGEVDIAKWGKDNLKPQRMLRLVAANHLKPQLIYTSRDFLLGSRLGVFKRAITTDPKNGRPKIQLEPVLDAQIEEDLEMLDATRYMRRASYNLEMFFSAFAQFGLAPNKKVETLLCHDCTDVRAQRIAKGKSRIEKYYLHADWENYRSVSELITLPAFDPRDPAKFGDFIYHSREEVPGQIYYPTPPWWGTEAWTKVSNLIPIFHINGLQNGYNIKYHIEIPLTYFEQFGEPEKQQEAEEELMADFNKWLAGVENPDKAFISKYATDSMGKPMPGWKITAIPNNMSDEAYVNLDKAANIAQTSGHGIDPSLASIDTGGRLGGSGSEKRISYQLHIALRTPNKRQILLEPLNRVVKKLNKWNAEHFVGFEDMELTTLEENPNGQQKVANQNQ